MQVRVLPPLPPSLFPHDNLAPSLAPVQLPAYRYLLGMYLGDGYVCRMARTYRLEVYLYWKDIGGIQRVGSAIRALLPTCRVGLRRHGNASVVTSYFKGWPAFFPQHGPGFKHSRPIVLRPWQRTVFEGYPFEFLRGCLDSDGCRHRRIVYGRDYPAYSFTNHSEDILRLFCEACDRLGIHWRRSNRVIISIARRPDVATLDRWRASATTF